MLNVDEAIERWLEALSQLHVAVAEYDSAHTRGSGGVTSLG